MEKKRVTLIFLIVLAAIALVLCYALFNPFVQPLISATVIAIVFYPVQSRMLRFVRSPSLAAALSTLTVILVIIIPAGLIALAISREVAHLIDYLNERSVESGGYSPFLKDLIDEPMAWISRYVDVSRFNPREWLLARLQQISSFLLAQLSTIAGNVASFLVNTVITLFSLFFLFREGRQIRRRAVAVLPLSPTQIEQLLTGIEQTIFATVYGGLVVAVVQGTLTGIALAAFRIPSPVLWGVIATIFALIPLVGTTFVWLPAALYLIIAGHWIQGIILIVWGAGVVGTIDNFLRPYLMSGQVKLHPLLIFLGVFGGVQAFGILGLFVGPVALAITITVFKMLWAETAEWRLRWRANAIAAESTALAPPETLANDQKEVEAPAPPAKVE
jgi:predicted PurR-regulated permease PerM